VTNSVQIGNLTILDNKKFELMLTGRAKAYSSLPAGSHPSQY